MNALSVKSTVSTGQANAGNITDATLFNDPSQYDGVLHSGGPDKTTFTIWDLGSAQTVTSLVYDYSGTPGGGYTDFSTDGAAWTGRVGPYGLGPTGPGTAASSPEGGFATARYVRFYPAAPTGDWATCETGVSVSPGGVVGPPATPDFSLAAAPTSLTISQGTAGTTTLTVQSLNHETASVGFTCPTLPAGWSAVFTPQTVTPGDGGTATSVLTIGAPYSAPVGAASITAVATAGDGTTHSITVPITITRGTAMSIPNTYVGVQSKIGIGREGSYGSPVLAQKLLDRKSGGLDTTFSDPDHQSLRGITSDVESVPGTSDTKGTIKLNVTPEGITRPLQMLLGDPTVVNTPAATGPPAIGAYNTATYLDTFTSPQIPHTIAEVRGPIFVIYPGCKAGGLNFSFDKTQNTPAEIDFELMALNELHEDTEAHIGTDLAGLDPLPAFGPSQIQVTIAGLVSQNAKSGSLAFSRGLKERQVLNFERGPVSHFPVMSSCTGTLDLYFDTDVDYKRFFGVLDAASVPYGASKTIRTIAADILLQSEFNAASPTGFQNQVDFVLPRISYKRLSAPVNGPDEIMQRIEFKTYHDTVTGSHFKVVVRNSETLAAITAVGTATAAGSVPANGVQALVV